MQTSDNELSGQVVKFLAEFTGRPVHRMTVASRIVEDLGVAGDDGDELMRQFAEKFNVDLSGFGKWNQFGGEGGPDPVSAILATVNFFKRKMSSNGQRRSPLIVQEFIDAARLKHWPQY